MNNLEDGGGPLTGIQLSSAMKQALKKAVRDGPGEVSQRTARALIARGLLKESGDLTNAGWEHGVELLPVREQCERLGLSWRIVHMNSPVSAPEASVVRALSARDITAYYTENAYGVHVAWFLAYPLTRLVEVLTRRKLYGLEPSSRKNHRRLLAMTAVLSGFLIRPTVVARTYRRLDARRRAGDGFFTDLWPSQFYELLVQSLGGRTLTHMLRLISRNPDVYTRGWPDITCFGEDDPFFIEVKTSDRLQRSQIRTIPALMSVTGIRVECWQIVHKEKKGTTGVESACFPEV